MFMQNLPTKVRINEVATRDGFQSEALFIPTDKKIEIIDRLSLLGLNKIEVTSFVSPKAIPNLRDAEEVMNSITRNPKITYVTLVPNEKGAERALATKADEVNLVMSVSESHNLSNMRMTCEQSLAQFKRICELMKGSSIGINASLATSFGCPFEGIIAPERVIEVIQQYLEIGIQSISIADTTGMASPRQVYELCSQVRDVFPSLDVTLHLHNTRGMGLANALAGLSAGITQLDASLGGIGGCPYAPGATGNICTEDLVHMLESIGLDTGVNLTKLLDMARELPELLEHDISGQIAKAGLRTETRSLSQSVIDLKARIESTKITN
ncbi:hydroxymethylglutaryl-CoA lyase [Marinomonas rhizomae]|uniref:Hydroxymethylglutaryl-CoA lyase n=1 Tax=Marinomonas rhizomae TaxID=491948 RepID=A0A366JF64_9GAMM|nr:hydroxymethylglutaryl-CoA lyase [Marinomonas rhizomae]RBP85616.1 hydroxymethylglutaryl-CoA lyase [Marinomonas rhizomae]RNF75756.1 hydroxymethylglutaryl-CoA lyase [Marinomonas rhizomae]